MGEYDLVLEIDEVLLAPNLARDPSREWVQLRWTVPGLCPTVGCQVRYTKRTDRQPIYVRHEDDPPLLLGVEWKPHRHPDAMAVTQERIKAHCQTHGCDWYSAALSERPQP